MNETKNENKAEVKIDKISFIFRQIKLSATELLFCPGIFILLIFIRSRYDKIIQSLVINQ